MSTAPKLDYHKPSNTATLNRRNIAVSQHPNLQVVPTLARPRRSWPVMVTVVALLLIALVVPVVLQTQMAMTSYEMHAMEQELSQLQDYHADLVTQAREAQSPQYLAQQATKIGLVPAGTQGYLTLATGEVVAGQPAK